MSVREASCKRCNESKKTFIFSCHKFECIKSINCIWSLFNCTLKGFFMHLKVISSGNRKSCVSKTRIVQLTYLYICGHLFTLIKTTHLFFPFFKIAKHFTYYNILKIPNQIMMKTNLNFKANFARYMVCLWCAYHRHK